MSLTIERIRQAKACGITVRQLEVLECYAEGMRGPEISKELGIAAETLHQHTFNLRDRLLADSIAHAVAIGFRNHFLK